MTISLWGDPVDERDLEILPLRDLLGEIRARLRYLAVVGTLASVCTLADYLPYVGLDNIHPSLPLILGLVFTALLLLVLGAMAILGLTQLTMVCGTTTIQTQQTRKAVDGI